MRSTMDAVSTTTSTLLRSTALLCSLFFFFSNTSTTEIYTLSLHDALPISRARTAARAGTSWPRAVSTTASCGPRSEEHTSELQSHHDLVCRLLLEKKNSPSSSLTASHAASLSCPHRLSYRTCAPTRLLRTR